MPIPEKIAIQRIEQYHTHYLGKTQNGRQYFGYVTFASPSIIPSGDWENYRREYAVLYIFDNEGNHLQTDHWYGGTTSEVRDEALYKRLEIMIEALGETTFEDIEVKPFQSVIDGFVFGLVPNSDGTIELQPSSTIEFYEPWDGDYNT